MKKNFFVVLLFTLSICCFLIGTSACISACKYVSKYELKDCLIRVKENNNSGKEIEYGKNFSDEHFEILFDKELNNEKVMDEWINRILKLNPLLAEKNYDGVHTVYISENVTSNYWVQDEETVYSFRPEISEEETLAWILYAKADGKLPYGVYAGVAAHWLDMAEYSSFVYSSLTNADYLTDLQFPLYETNNLPAKERMYAWSFAYALVNDWSHTGKNEIELLSLDNEKFVAFMQEKYNLEIPNYTFLPYSSKYEYKVEQNTFTYYINKEYNDLVLPKKEFSTSYNFLSDWLKDNAKAAMKSNEIFNVSESYPINIYLDDGLKSTGAMGDLQTTAGRNNIVLNSVGTFSNYYIYYIFYQKAESGYLRDAMTDIHANDSKYANLTYYYIFSGEADNYLYRDDNKVDEKNLYNNAMDLYNKISIEKATTKIFNFWLFADCYAAQNTSDNETFTSRLQQLSLINYIKRVYGEDNILKMHNDGMNVVFDGKTYSEVRHDWIEYLRTISI